jgi:hypothetical protein
MMIWMDMLIVLTKIAMALEAAHYKPYPLILFGAAQQTLTANLTISAGTRAAIFTAIAGIFAYSITIKQTSA